MVPGYDLLRHESRCAVARRSGFLARLASSCLVRLGMCRLRCPHRILPSPSRQGGGLRPAPPISVAHNLDGGEPHAQSPAAHIDLACWKRNDVSLSSL